MKERLLPETLPKATKCGRQSMVQGTLTIPLDRSVLLLLHRDKLALERGRDSMLGSAWVLEENGI